MRWAVALSLLIVGHGTDVHTTRDVGPKCAAMEENCKDTGCCQDAGLTCFERDSSWATCLNSCWQGSPLQAGAEPLVALSASIKEARPPSSVAWSCRKLGPKAPLVPWGQPALVP